MTEQTTEELEKIDEQIAERIQPNGRVLEWLKFSNRVLDHVQHYTIPAYGDMPNDPLTDWSPADCVRQIGKYVDRFESNPRGKTEGLRDLLKIAHYAGVAFFKLQKELELTSALEAPPITIVFPNEPLAIEPTPSEPAKESGPVFAGEEIFPKWTWTFSSDLLDMLLNHEGKVLQVYPDPKGIKTIGIGRNLEGNPLTAEEERFVGATTQELLSGEKSLTHADALYLLVHDVQNIVTSLTGFPWFDCLTENRKNALISVCMMGTKKFYAFHETHQHILAGEWIDAGQHLLNAKWAADVKRKRSMECALMVAYDLPFSEAEVRYRHRLFGDLSFRWEK